MINVTTFKCLASLIALTAVVLVCSLDTHNDNEGGHKWALTFPFPALKFNRIKKKN